MEERKKHGLGDTLPNDTKKVSMRGTNSKTISSVKRLMEAPSRLLQEDDMNIIYDDLCLKCQQHCDLFVSLTCGRGAQHINSDIDINEMINELNRNDILDLLIVEKGPTAKMMIQTLDLTEPPEIMYKKHHVIELLKDLETDYDERYDFSDL